MADIDIQQLVEKKASQFGDQIVSRIRQKLIAAGKLGTGALVESIQYRVYTDDGIVKLDIIANDYFKWVDQGIRPGGKMPPKQVILDWVNLRGLRPKPASGIPESNTSLPRTNNSLAFLIGRKIARDGIPATNVLGTTLGEIQNPLTESIENIVADAITEIIGEGFEDLAKSLNNDIIKITTSYSK